MIIKCPECASRHLIADNLGWFGRGGPRNVEELLQEKGQGAQSLLSDVSLHCSATNDLAQGVGACHAGQSVWRQGAYRVLHLDATSCVVV